MPHWLAAEGESESSPKLDLDFWTREMSRRIPAPPRPLAFRGLPWPIAVGAGAALLVGLIAWARGGMPQASHPPDYAGVAVLLSPFLLWGWKVWREARVLRYGNACVGQITSTTAPLAFRDRFIQMFCQTRLRCVAYEYTDASGGRQTGRKLDWWLEQNTGKPVFVFTDRANPRRSVLQGCSIVRVRGIEY